MIISGSERCLKSVNNQRNSPQNAFMSRNNFDHGLVGRLARYFIARKHEIADFYVLNWSQATSRLH